VNDITNFKDHNIHLKKNRHLYIMNSSQLLYKISNLKYSIRMKELEYKDALVFNQELKKDEYREALILLNEDLHKTIQQMESLESNPQKLHTLPLKRRVPFFSKVFSRSIFGKKL
jgi:hypothetical protein